MHHDTIQLCKSRKDYAQYIQKYPRVYHKYLFGMYDGMDLILLIANQKTKRLCVDLFLKETKLRTINNYGYTPENQYGKYAPDVAMWEQEQIEKAKHIVTNDQIDVNKIRYVGGLDISFDPIDDTKGVGYITIYDLIEKKIVYEYHKKATLCVPYISGFLGFREVTEYMEILKKVKNDKPEYFPDVLMIDGFGILHHRGFGSASHIGYESQIPTIGVAKTLLYIDGLNEQTVKEKFRQECKKTGDYVDLIGESGTLYGVGYKSTSESLKPIYISVGHNISLESCIKIVNMCTKYRIPEPIRNSDIKSKLFM
jgi:deoxyinosine 3'endonuclease (endonuclease V)